MRSELAAAAFTIRHSGSAESTAACLVLSSLVACAGVMPKATTPDVKPWPEIRPDYRVETLRARMHKYPITFAAEVDLAASAIERRAGATPAGRNAVSGRLAPFPRCGRPASGSSRSAPWSMSAWILVRQMIQLFSTGAGADAFGELQPEALEVSGRLVEQVRAIGGSIAVSPEMQAEFERKFVDPWLAQHPLQDLSFVRESPIARFAEQSRAAGDTFQSVGTMEDVAIACRRTAYLPG